MFFSSCPDMLPGMDHKVTGELLYSMLNSLNKELNTNLNPNILIANSWVTDPRPENELPEEIRKKKNDIAGASNMRRLVLSLKMAGYEVIDLSQPSWLATTENVALLAGQLTSLGLDPETHVIGIVWQQHFPLQAVRAPWRYHLNWVTGTIWRGRWECAMISLSLNLSPPPRLF
jgi:hypothetical protein